jgi:hypothetical protein
MVIDSLTAYDRVQLLEIYARSVMFLELGRYYEEWAQLFIPDALVSCPEFGSRLGVQFNGTKEQVAFARRLASGEFDLAVGRLVPPLQCRHLVSNITLFGTEPQGASAYALATVTAVGGPEPPRWLASGRYSDRLSKSAAGCWRFQSRTFTPDGCSPCTRRKPI